MVNSDLAATTKHILLTLSIHANDLGETSWPSVRTLERETGLSQRSICTHILLAAQKGWIKKGIKGFSDQGWKRHEYTFQWPEGTEAGSARSEKVLNVIPKGAERHDIKVLNDVQSNSTTNSTTNSTILSDSVQTAIQTEPTPQYTIFQEVQRLYQENNQGRKVSWNGHTGKKLFRLLQNNKSWPLEDWLTCVRNRFASEVNKSEDPIRWIDRLPDYLGSPLDRFGKPKEEDWHGPLK